MRRAERAERIAEQLQRLYPKTPIPLDHTDPFTLLIAVLLSAQTTDKRVNGVTPELFRLGPNAAAMQTRSPAEVLAIIRPLGLAPGKARAVVGLAKMLIRDHDGQVPESFEALEALPGVGHKTASVVMAQAFGHAAFPVDTHIHRLSARWGLSSGRNVTRTEDDLKRSFPSQLWNKLHLQFIFFGREYCRARGHDLATCPICSWAATKKRMALEAKLGGSPKNT
jgi:endonuclease-3